MSMCNASCIELPDNHVSESAYVRQYLPLVLSVVSHLRSQAGSVIDCDDFKQVGLMGLLEAIRKYGREPDEKFGAYAKKRIRGAILDDLRKKDMRSRGDRDKAHAFSDAKKRLQIRLGHVPNDKELMSALQLSSHELLSLQYLEQASLQQRLNACLYEGAYNGDIMYQPFQADNPVSENQGHEDQSTKHSLSKVEKALLLKKILASLKPAYQAVMSLYYVDQLNMKEIAQALALSESRVCQIHKHALATLIKSFSE